MSRIHRVFSKAVRWYVDFEERYIHSTFCINKTINYILEYKRPGFRSYATMNEDAAAAAFHYDERRGGDTILVRRDEIPSQGDHLSHCIPVVYASITYIISYHIISCKPARKPACKPALAPPCWPWSKSTWRISSRKPNPSSATANARVCIRTLLVTR
jgi:hypothetical protein